MDWGASDLALKCPPAKLDRSLCKTIAFCNRKSVMKFLGSVVLPANDVRPEHFRHKVKNRPCGLSNIVREEKRGGFRPSFVLATRGFHEHRVYRDVLTVRGAPRIDQRHPGVESVQAINPHEVLLDAHMVTTCTN